LAREQGDHSFLDSGDHLRDGRLRDSEDSMNAVTRGERIGVLGLARSGVAAARLALSRGASVYASDVSDSEATRNAAARLRELGADAEAGRHDLEKLANCSRIVLSPGIPPGVAVLRAPELAEVPIIPEIELAFE